MVDIKLFESILEAQDNGYIETGDKITFELLELFSKHAKIKVQTLFKKSYGIAEKFYYDCECKCSVCNKTFFQTMSKTETFNYISKYNKNYKCLCNECKEELKRTEKEREIKREEQREKDKRDNTDNYIKNYLNPSCSWRKGVKSYSKIRSLTNVYVDWNVIKEYILKMDYTDFLCTPYWKAISERVKQKAGYRCQLCNSNNDLNVHHRTYENHGDEISHMDDLICICNECHEKHHFN